MIEWYNNSNLLSIYFSDLPDARELYPTPGMTKEQKADIEDKPFVCRNKVRVILFDHKKKKRHIFTIPKNYRWDGASIPWGLWNVIGSPTSSKFLIASMLHDRMCENHAAVEYDRYFADKVFERCLYVAGVGNFKRWLMFHSVDNFQKTCGWNKKEGE